MISSTNATLIGPKPTKACVNCRRQKMKCEVDPDRTSSCKRCRQSQTPCIFKPRANAAVVHDVPSPTKTSTEKAGLGSQPPSLDPQMVLSRLQAIETLLGIESSTEVVLNDDVALRPPDAESPFNGVFTAAAHLKTTTRPPQSSKIWSQSVIKQLWLSFHKNMPGLHFLSKKKTSSTPTPLLLAAILYVSALHHPSPELAVLGPGYFVATCSAISELAVPLQALSHAGHSATGYESQKLSEEQRAFQNVLGLILAGLISEAFIETAGLWISMGYRLTLDHCPVHIDERSHEWRGLFSGLQIIDLEHASLHMSCPIVPKEAPLPSLRQLQSSAKDPFYSLTQMMHSGLSHFTGRGLPTIWSFICSNQLEGSPKPAYIFTDADSKLIREWARQLDDWLVLWNKSNDPELDSLMVFRQYSLHRLFVLSIYHPARGFDLFANNVASIERHELLISARATLKLQNEDKGIWSNWDLVMITWAALLVLQGVEGGVGEPDDFILIQSHLNMLQQTHQPAPSLRHTLATRLESSLQNMHTPRPAPEPLSAVDMYDSSWAIFDQNSIALALGNGFGNGSTHAAGGGGGMTANSGEGGSGNGNGMVIFTAGNGNVGAAVGGAELDDGSGGGVVGASGGAAVVVDDEYGGGESLDGDGQWFGNEHYADAWQNTLFRLFGNAEMQMTGNEFVPTGT